jgi:hypothetical protein
LKMSRRDKMEQKDMEEIYYSEVRSIRNVG